MIFLVSHMYICETLKQGKMLYVRMAQGVA